MYELYYGKYAEELRAAVVVAKEAGAVALKYHGTDLDVYLKAGDEPVTVADLECSKLIVSRLKALYPDDAVVSEEDDKTDPKKHTAKRVWYVDPIDGTKHFVKGDSKYCVMLGLAVDNEPVLGVVYQPNTERVVAASKGNGAWVQLGEGDYTARLRCGSSTWPLKDARLLTSSSSNNAESLSKCLGLDPEKAYSGGSVGMKLAAIAACAGDVYVNTTSNCGPWDTCAPQVILQEAGGSLTDLKGNALRYDTEARSGANGLVASNGPLHKEVVERLVSL